MPAFFICFHLCAEMNGVFKMSALERAYLVSTSNNVISSYYYLIIRIRSVLTGSYCEDEL
jgi:hypothetical protein